MTDREKELKEVQEAFKRLGNKFRPVRTDPTVDDLKSMFGIHDD